MADATPTVELTEDDVAIALRNPLAAHERLMRRAKTSRTGLGARSLRVDRPAAPVVVPHASSLWSGTMESIVLDSAERLAGLLGDNSPRPADGHVVGTSSSALRAYLRMNVVRVVRVVEALQRRGISSGDVLEVGAWFGSFCLPLRRLGYRVTAVDRYASYGDTFDTFVGLMSTYGVEVVSATRENELRTIAGLRQFDVVLACAVIEHVPHTPRRLLETLFDRVRPGGVLLVDTPNLARYWNRRALERGDSIFQPLQDQFMCTEPWEGHHREYTAEELRWMLDHVGCVDVEVEFLDYNMLQFEELSAEHIECLATIIEDPTQSDIVLGVAARGGGDQA